MKKILFILGYASDGAKEVFFQHLKSSLILDEKGIVSEFLLVVKEGEPAWNGRHDFQSNSKKTFINMSDSAGIIKFAFDSLPNLIVCNRQFEASLFQVKPCPIILDVHFCLKEWVLLNNMSEIFKSDFFNLESPQLAVNQLLNFKSSLTSEVAAIANSDLLISNSSSTSIAIQTHYPSAKFVEAKIFTSSPIPEYNAIEKFTPSAASFDNPADFRKGVYRLFSEKNLPFSFTCYGMKENDKNFISPLCRENMKPWMDDFEEFKTHILKYPFILFPSAYETFGLSLNLCLGLGRICIVQDENPGFDEQVEDGQTGFKLDFRRLDWVQKVQEIMSLEESKLRLISRNAYESYLNRSRGYNRIQSIAQILMGQLKVT